MDEGEIPRKFAGDSWPISDGRSADIPTMAAPAWPARRSLWQTAPVLCIRVGPPGVGSARASRVSYSSSDRRILSAIDTEVEPEGTRQSLQAGQCCMPECEESAHVHVQIPARWSSRTITAIRPRPDPLTVRRDMPLASPSPSHPLLATTHEASVAPDVPGRWPCAGAAPEPTSSHTHHPVRYYAAHPPPRRAKIEVTHSTAPLEAFRTTHPFPPGASGAM